MLSARHRLALERLAAEPINSPTKTQYMADVPLHKLSHLVVILLILDQRA